MKNIVFTTLCLFSSLVVNAQTISIVSNKDFELKNPTVLYLPKIPDTARIIFKINNIPAKDSVTFQIEDKNEGTAEPNSDYKIITSPLNKKIYYNGSNLFEIGIHVLTAKEKTIILYVTCIGSKKDVYKITLDLNTKSDVISLLNPAKPQASVVPDTSKWNVRIITGSNFDFFNGPKIKDFAGELSINLPNIFAIKSFKDHPIGVQFGLFNFHYFQSDSSGVFKNQDYYYLHPQDAFRSYDSTRIIQRSYSVNRKLDYNIWGVFIEPLMKLCENEFAQLYFSAHFEALSTTQTYSPTVKYISRDTFFYSPQKLTYIPQSNISAHPAVPYAYKQNTFYDFYYGVGLPLKVNVNNKLIFNIAPTIGRAKIQTLILQDPFDNVLRFSNGIRSDYTGFFLAKYQLITTVAPIDIAFGGEYRSIFGKMHYLTNYIGASITLDKLKR